MFDYPLPLPFYTLYEELGLVPEATQDEIRDAITERRRELQNRQKEVVAQLSAIYDAVPGLRDQESTVATLRLDTAQVLDKDRESQLRLQREELDRLERSAFAINANFRQLRQQSEDIKRQEEALNTFALSSPDKRRAYDREHPPLALFKLADCEQNDLFDRNHGDAALTLLRQEVSNFLSDKEEIVFHPSDLTRLDFSADFTFVDLLDGDTQSNK